jgi:DNA-binding CsgD family transcriptional regulator
LLAHSGARDLVRSNFIAEQQQVHGLSPAEALLLESALANLRPRHQLGGHVIGYETAKTHKRRIFEKFRATGWVFADWEDLCRLLRLALEASTRQR